MDAFTFPEWKPDPDYQAKVAAFLEAGAKVAAAYEEAITRVAAELAKIEWPTDAHIPKAD